MSSISFVKGRAVSLWQALPERITTPVDIVRRSPHWRSVGAIFIHVPKAAGGSVSRAIYGRPLGHFYAVDIRRVLPADFARLYKFSVVRHPVDRLLSAYRFARAGGTADMAIRSPRRYQTAEFETFERFVLEWLTERDVASLDGVFRPQYLYLCDGKDIIVDEIFRFEEVGKGMAERLSRALGRTVVIGHYNRTRQGDPPHISRACRSVIETLYREDFEVFGFKKGC